MTYEKKKLSSSYQSVSDRYRFWLHSEACYTEEELNQRAWILKTRASSGLDADYLANPGSWFADDAQALINVYEHSWFYSNAFRTRQVLTLDDFHVQPMDSHRLHWTALYDLMQKTGDYLLIRNQKLSAEHLNQPMNFFLLDLNHILKRISQNPSIKQTQEQLGHLTRYVRTIEKSISPFKGTDRLFLANFRTYIDDEVLPHLTNLIESQLLKDRLGELSKTLEQISTDRNRILHFALNANYVNPHPYTFAIDTPEDLSAYPTQAAKECGKTGTQIMRPSMSPLKLTIQQLEECSNLQLISRHTDILEHYAHAITDLNELDHFQKVIAQSIDLLGQAGEVFTVYQFKEQLLLLLQQIDLFIDESSLHIEHIIHANTQAYHKAIQEEQKASYLKRWLSMELEKLSTFIRNQDTLAQFPSTKADLFKTSQTLKEQVNHVITHLQAIKIKEIHFDAIGEKAQELNVLMMSMHRWVANQHEIKGLKPPIAPNHLTFIPPDENRPKNPLPTETQTHSFSCIVTNETDSALNTIFSNLSSQPSCQNSSFRPLPATSICDDRIDSQCILPSDHVNMELFLGMSLLIPFGIVLLFCVYYYQTASKNRIKIQGSKEEFDNLKDQFDDLIVDIQKNMDTNNQEFKHDFECVIDRYNELNKEDQTGNYNTAELRGLYEDMEAVYNEYLSDSAPVSNPGTLLDSPHLVR